jgi:non-ribosomal peptide synthetase component F
VLDPALAEPLRALAQRERSTPFIVLLAVLKAVLHHRLGVDDLVVGTPFSLRGRPEAAGLVGFLLNLLVLRTDLGGDPTFAELLARVRDTALGAFSHREVPFERLAEELCPGGEPGSTPWVRVLFNMPTGGAGHPEAIRAGGIEVQPLLTGEVGSEFDLTFYAREQGSGIRLDLGYNAGLLAAGEAAALLAELAALAGEAVAAPEQRISELSGAVVPGRAGG